MIAAGVTMPDGVDVPEAVTRKIGPLPAWGWVVAISGAVIVFRLLKGGSAGGSGSSGIISGAPTTVGGAGTTDLSGGAGDIIGSGPAGILSQLQTDISKSGAVQALQAQLINLLNNRSSLLSKDAQLRVNLNRYNDLLRACKTAACKKTNKAHVTTVSAQIKSNSSAITALNTQIAALQQQVSATNG
jgi:hypothetical protein